MRYCVSGRQPYSVMNKADEIKFSYADQDKIFDLIERYPNKSIILDLPVDEYNWDKWRMYSEKFAEFHVAIHNLKQVPDFTKNGIKWYWPYPITSYYELKIISEKCPSYLLIGPPLSFDLEEIKTLTTIPLRMVVNVASPKYLQTGAAENITGQWVRPEDVEFYEEKVQCFEFDEVNLTEEETLLHIYKDNKKWPGNLNLLIKRLNYNVDNKILPEDIGKARVKCGQRCQKGDKCKLCYTAFIFTNNLREFSKKRKIEN